MKITLLLCDIWKSIEITFKLISKVIFKVSKKFCITKVYAAQNLRGPAHAGAKAKVGDEPARGFCQSQGWGRGRGQG